jgi:hypothetical protein
MTILSRGPSLFLTFSLLLFFSLQANLPSIQEVQYNGQEREAFNLENILNETRYREEMRDATCYRDVPYNERECEDIPRYDNVCTNIPGYENCQTEYERVCHDVTLYREECSGSRDEVVCRNERRTRKECDRGSSQRSCRYVTRTREECQTDNSNRECRTEPSREQCRTNRSGVERCRTIPGREVCENKPERTCRNVSYQDEVCETTPGELECRQVPYYENVCSTIPGNRRCEDVPYTDTQCEDIPSQSCQWVPSREECSNVQVGSDEVCRDITRYREESYACQEAVQVPYIVELKKFETEGNILFHIPEDYDQEFSFITSLSKQGSINFLFNGVENLLAFVHKKETREVLPSSGELEHIKIKGEYDLKFKKLDEMKKKIFPATEFKLTEDLLTFEMPQQKLTKSMNFFLEFREGDKELVSKDLLASDYKIKSEDGKFKIAISLKALKLKAEKLKKYQYKVIITPQFSETVVYPKEETLSFKKEGSIFTLLDDASIELLKSELDNLSHLSMDGQKITFRFPNHQLIKSGRYSLKLGEFQRQLTEDETSLNINSEFIEVTILLKEIGIKVSPLAVYSPEVEVEYVFSQEAPLPVDFSYKAQLSKELTPSLSSEDIKELVEDASVIKGVSLHKRSLSFKIKNNPILKGFKAHIKIRKKSKSKFNQEITDQDVRLKEGDEYTTVRVSLSAYGVKLSRWGKHSISISIKYDVHPEIERQLPDYLSGAGNWRLKAK